MAIIFFSSITFSITFIGAVVFVVMGNTSLSFYCFLIAAIALFVMLHEVKERVQ